MSSLRFGTLGGALILLMMGACSDSASDDDDPSESTTSTGAEGSSTSTGMPSGSTDGGDGSTGDGSEGPVDASSSGESGDEFPDAGKIIYLNFDGVELSGSSENSQTNQYPYREYHGVYGPVTEALQRETITEMVQLEFEDFDIAFVTERPTQGDYMMVVVSPDWQPTEGPVTGISSVDCGDVFANDIGIVAIQPDTLTTANLVASVVGRALGLDWVENQLDLAAYEALPQTRDWLDECVPLGPPQAGSPRCPLGHANFCEAGLQNSYRELLDRLGPAR